jgi:hypothetical protein
VPKVRQANRLRNRVDEGSNGVAAAASERQDNCDMHGLLYKEKLVQKLKIGKALQHPNFSQYVRENFDRDLR